MADLTDFHFMSGLDISGLWLQTLCERSNFPPLQKTSCLSSFTPNTVIGVNNIVYRM